MASKIYTSDEAKDRKREQTLNFQSKEIKASSQFDYKDQCKRNRIARENKLSELEIEIECLPLLDKKREVLTSQINALIYSLNRGIKE